PRRARGIPPLNGTVIKRPFRILPILRDLLPPFASLAALYKNVRVKGGLRRHRQHFTVPRVHSEYRSAFRCGALDLFFRGHLEAKSDRRNHILTALRRNYRDLVLSAAATINDHPSVARTTAKKLIIVLFKPAFSDYVTGLHPGPSFRHKLFRADLAH